MKVLGVFIIVLLIIVFLLAVFGFTVTKVMFRMSYRSFQIDPVSPMKHYEDYRDKYPREIVHFPSGKHMLQGYMYGNPKSARALIVFSHGIWSGPEEYMVLITWFLDRNYAVFTYDYTGYNGSEGNSANGLPQSPLDQNAALDYVESVKEWEHLKILTLGHSWGAYATTAGLNFDHRVVAACGMSGFNDPIKISVETAKMMLGPIGALNRPWIWILDRIRFPKYHRLTAVSGINHANIPVLLTHGRGDDFIPYDISSIVCKKDEIKNPKLRIHTIEEPGHYSHTDFFLSLEAAEYMAEITGNYEKLKKQYKKGIVPQDVKKAFFDKVDKDRANAPAEEFFEVIDHFYREALENTD